MDRTTFRRIVLKSAFQKRKMYETLLESVHILKSLSVSSNEYGLQLVPNFHRPLHPLIFSVIRKNELSRCVDFQNF